MNTSFFENLISGNQTTPPYTAEQGLLKHFPDAINTEWYKSGNDYEAVFYSQNIEHIARFTAFGDLKEYKMNVDKNRLPMVIIRSVESLGEIMSAVLINRLPELTYEIIMRDQLLKRFVVVTRSTGEIIRKQTL